MGSTIPKLKLPPNEPIKSYAPGTSERASLKSRLDSMLSASVESASPSSTMASRQAQYAVGLSACIERRNAYADLTRWFRSSPADEVHDADGSL